MKRFLQADRYLVLEEAHPRGSEFNELDVAAPDFHLMKYDKRSK